MIESIARAEFPILRVCLIAALLVLWSGCAVGPDFTSPRPPDITSYTGNQLPQETDSAPAAGGTAQRFVPAAEIPEQWWALFQSKELERLIHQALAGSPTLQAAEATLRQAQENVRAQAGITYYPAIDLNAGAQRQKISGAAFGEPGASFSPFTLYNASVGFTYALDLFGGGRRQLESLRAQVDVQRFRLAGARLALTANVVTAAIQEASLRAQLQALEEMVSVMEQEVNISAKRFELGAISRTDLLALQAQLAQTRASLPGLEYNLKQIRNQMAILLGKVPPESALLPAFTLDGLQLPVELPLSLPSDLVRQRPDIVASEALLHAASAEIGVATANLYPQITLSGSYGASSTTPGSLLSATSTIWSLSGALLQPLFHGGELTARRRAAIAVYDQAEAQYRSTVLLAFQNVSDVLNALESDARTLKAQAATESVARDLLDLTYKQFQVGAVSHLVLLNAERQYQQARIGLVQAQAARYADTAALFQALGGGWWNRKPAEAKME